MVTVETVLVLGAGASCDFGFPTGKKLVTQIYTLLTASGSKLPNLFFEIAGQENPEMAENFPHILQQANPLSIDAWLQHNEKLIPAGKIAIAIALLWYEQRSKLRPENNWYQLLFQRLDSIFEEFQNNKISIITFNYDRSLEEYLFKSFRNTHFDKSEDDCKNKLNQLKILHVYGSLGRLEWQSNDPEDPLPQVSYGAKPDTYTVHSAADSIKIIPEKSPDLQEFNDAHKLIGSANALYFLGFGYHEMNMQRLGIDTLRKPSKIMGTSYGLDYQRMREIEQLSIRDLSRNNGLVDKSVYDFLYHYINFNELGLPKVFNY